jgi:hypothetical protein
VVSYPEVFVSLFFRKLRPFYAALLLACFASAQAQERSQPAIVRGSDGRKVFA